MRYDVAVASPSSATSRRYYSPAKLSDRISETPEGFLVCEGVPITRSGQLLYSPSETPVTPGDGATVIYRLVKDIHDPATIASFEGKPVTIDHPSDFVTPDNWQELAVGVVQNVRPGTGDQSDLLLADLLITDREAIEAVKSRRLREVSCGYEAEYIEVAPGVGRQESIIGNHVALVEQGRCGSACSIQDSAPPKTEKRMTLKQKLMGVFGQALDEAMPEETPPTPAESADADEPTDVATMLKAVMARLDALEAKMGAGDADGDMYDAEEGDPEATAAPEGKIAGTAAEADPSPAASTDPLGGKLDAILEALGKLLQMELKEQEQEMTEVELATADSATVARAEILAPGIAKTGDVKSNALRAAYGTVDGKAVIDSLLGAKTLSNADTDMLFVAASELVKTARRGAIRNTVSLDSLPGMQPGPMTPEKINELNAAKYGSR